MSGEGLEFPVALDKIDIFERKNDIPVNISVIGRSTKPPPTDQPPTTDH